MGLVKIKNLNSIEYDEKIFKKLLTLNVNKLKIDAVDAM